MANEEKPGETFTITDISIFCEDAVFYSKQTFSDLIIIIEGQKIYAHKVILAARCEYFQYLLTENVNKTEITITDVPVKAFRKLLKFIYTGSITLLSSDTDLIFDVMKLASNYSFKKLEAAISQKISSMINFDHVFDLLNKAVANNMEGLTNVCLSFMDEDPLEILESDYLCSLTQKSMVKLLERDSFGAPEIDIFKSVAKWCKNNKDDKNLVMHCVRLSSLTNEEILTVVFPSKLVESEKLLTIMAQAVDGKPNISNPRRMTPIFENLAFKEETNLSTHEYEAKAISGVNSDLLLGRNRNINLYAHHIINDQEGITIELKNPSYVNHIYMRLWDKGEPKNYYYSYYIEVSADRKQWKKIIDYSRYHCRSFQKLYFERVRVRYIRVVGTTSSYNDEFRLIFLQVFSTNDVPKTQDGIVCPTENVATLDKGAIVLDSRIQNCLLNQESQFTYHKIPGNSIIIQLAQPYVISSIKMLLLFFTRRIYRYRYFVETSVDKNEWKIAVDYRNELRSLWQNLTFDKRPAVYIRISGTYCSEDKYFYCSCFECPSFDKK